MLLWAIGARLLFSHVVFLRAKPGVPGGVEVSTMVPDFLFTSMLSVTPIINGAGNCLTPLRDTLHSSNTLMTLCTDPGACGSVGLGLLQDHSSSTSRLLGQALEIPRWVKRLPVLGEFIALRCH